MTNKKNNEMITRGTLDTNNIVVNMFTEIKTLGMKMKVYTGYVGDIEEIEIQDKSAYICQEDSIGYACIIHHIDNIEIKHGEKETVIEVLIKPEI